MADSGFFKAGNGDDISSHGCVDRFAVKVAKDHNFSQFSLVHDFVVTVEDLHRRVDFDGATFNASGKNFPHIRISLKNGG